MILAVKFSIQEEVYHQGDVPIHWMGGLGPVPKTIDVARALSRLLSFDTEDVILIPAGRRSWWWPRNSHRPPPMFVARIEVS